MRVHVTVQRGLSLGTSAYELPIAAIGKGGEGSVITMDDLQRVFALYIDKRKRREIAELSEAATTRRVLSMRFAAGSRTGRRTV
jgi:hypothetical protein